MTLDPQLARTAPVIALAVAVAIVYPVLGLRRYRRIEHLPEPLPTRTRLGLYANVILSQWTLVALTALVFAAAARSFADLGQSLGPSPGVTLAVAGGLLILFGVLSMFTTRQLREASASDLPDHLKRAGKILPRTGPERLLFSGVAFTAGVCEEILYRGFLPWFLASWTGSVLLAFVLSAIVFGLGHAYQGRNGIVVTGLLGLFFGGIAWSVHSLVPGQVLHFVVDLVNGLAVGGALARLQTATPVGPPAPPAETPPAGEVDASAAPPA